MDGTHILHLTAHRTDRDLARGSRWPTFLVCMSKRGATFERSGSFSGMKRLATAATTSLVLLLVFSQAADAKPPTAAQCPPAKSHVMLADAQVTLYSVVEPVGLYHDKEVRIYGCAHGHMPVLLGGIKLCYGSPCGGPERETLAGPLVAYQDGGGGEESRTYVIVVRNLRTGKVIRRVPTGTLVPAKPSVIGVGPAVAIIAKPDGAVAWIAKTSPVDPEYQVHAVDSSGSRTLASGTNIGPSSLALAGSTLYWTQNGQAMSAPLN